MNASTDPIRVLLIDDKPEGLGRLETCSGRPNPERVPHIHAPAEHREYASDLASCFDLRWIATAAEGREYRDLSHAAAMSDAFRLGSEGWIPEIICFDYALTKDTRIVADRLPEARYQQLSPLPALRALTGITKKGTPAPHTGTGVDDDNLGCYVGGLTFSLFSDHPCAPVALTRKGAEKTRNTEAGFFEWMLELDTHAAFAQKGRASFSWLELLREGAGVLRRRIEVLSGAGIIDVSVDDLCTLAATGQSTRLEICSRYGRRNLPVSGLFLDGADRKQWAGALAQTLLATPPEQLATDLGAARILAERVWNKYCDKVLVSERLELSRLLKRVLDGRLPEDVSLATTDEARHGHERLIALIDAFALDVRIGEIRSKGLARKVIKNNDRWAGLHATDTFTSPAQRRWAALFLVIRLFHLYWTRRCETGPEEWRALHPSDIWFVWFPAPRAPAVLPWDDGGDASGAWGNEFGRDEQRQDVNPDVILGRDTSSGALTALELRVLEQEARRLYGSELSDDPLIRRFLRDGRKRARVTGEALNDV